jgi:hypothetical protein
VLAEGNCAAAAILYLLDPQAGPVIIARARRYRLDVSEGPESLTIGGGMQQRLNGQSSEARLAWRSDEGMQAITWAGVLARLQPTMVYQDVELEIHQIGLMVEHSRVNIRIWRHNGHGEFYSVNARDGLPPYDRTIHLLYDQRARHYWALQEVEDQSPLDLPRVPVSANSGESKSRRADPVVT